MPCSRPRLLLAALALLVGVAACSGDDSESTSDGEATGASDGTTTTDEPAVTGSDLADVTVVEPEGEAGVPTLEFDAPFGVAETTSLVLTEGEGEAVADGAVAEFDFLFVNATDGSTLGTTYDAEPAELAVEDGMIAGVREALLGAKPGSRVLTAIAPDDGPGADPGSGVDADDTVLFLVDVHSVRFPLQRAEGEAVAPEEGLPQVTLDDAGAPTIDVEGVAAPTALVAQPLIRGAGAVVEAGQTITVHYTGVLLADGSVFDSSWEGGAPATFPIGTGGVIAGWDEGLVGQPVGSQVLLVIPSDKGYGASGTQGIPPDADLVFVVDILDAR